MSHYGQPLLEFLFYVFVTAIHCSGLQIGFTQVSVRGSAQNSVPIIRRPTRGRSNVNCRYGFSVLRTFSNKTESLARTYCKQTELCILLGIWMSSLKSCQSLKSWTGLWQNGFTVDYTFDEKTLQWPRHNVGFETILVWHTDMLIFILSYLNYIGLRHLSPLTRSLDKA